MVNDPDKFFDMVLVAYNMKSEASVKRPSPGPKRQASAFRHEDSGGQLQKGRRPSRKPRGGAAALKWVLQTERNHRDSGDEDLGSRKADGACHGNEI